MMPQEERPPPDIELLAPPYRCRRLGAGGRGPVRPGGTRGSPGGCGIPDAMVSHGRAAFHQRPRPTRPRCPTQPAALGPAEVFPYKRRVPLPAMVSLRPRCPSRPSAFGSATGLPLRTQFPLGRGVPPARGVSAGLWRSASNGAPSRGSSHTSPGVPLAYGVRAGLPRSARPRCSHADAGCRSRPWCPWAAVSQAACGVRVCHRIPRGCSVPRGRSVPRGCGVPLGHGIRPGSRAPRNRSVLRWPRRSARPPRPRFPNSANGGACRVLYSESSFL